MSVKVETVSCINCPDYGSPECEICQIERKLGAEK